MHVRLASYTPQEIAQRLKVSRRTVYLWLEELSVQEKWDLKEFLGRHRIGEPEEEQE